VVKIGDIKLKEWENDVAPQRRRVKKIYLHPLYNSTLNYHDIGLIELNRPVEYTWFVKPARLWPKNDIPYGKLHTMGYGSTGFAQPQTNILTELDLSVVPIDQCNTSLPADESAPQGILTSQICAHDYEKNRDTCQVSVCNINGLRTKGFKRPIIIYLFKYFLFYNNLGLHYNHFQNIKLIIFYIITHL